MAPKNRPDVMLYLDDHRGIYIPRDFVQGTKRECMRGISDDDIEILSDPEHEWYWETWDDVLNGGTVVDPVSGVVYRLYQDGALWLIPDGMEWDDREEWYRWPEPTQETRAQRRQRIRVKASARERRRGW